MNDKTDELIHFLDMMTRSFVIFRRSVSCAWHQLTGRTLAPLATASSISSWMAAAAPGMHIAPQSTVSPPSGGPCTSEETALLQGKS